MVFVFACSEWDLDRIGFTRVITIGAIEIGSNSAFLIGDIENIRMSSVIESGFVLSSSAADEERLRLNQPNVRAQHSPGMDTIFEDRAFAARIAGLNGSTEYFFRAYVKIEGEELVVYGDVENFTTGSISLQIVEVKRLSTECSTKAIIKVQSEGLLPGGGLSIHLVYSESISNPFPTIKNGIVVDGAIPNASGFAMMDLDIPCEAIRFVRAFVAPPESEPIYSSQVAFSSKVDGHWFKRRSFPEDREFVADFSIGQYYYLGGGNNGSDIFSTYFKYDVLLDHWELIGEFPQIQLSQADAFSINGVGYLTNGRKHYTQCEINTESCPCSSNFCRNVGMSPCALSDCTVFPLPLIPCECYSTVHYAFRPKENQWHEIGLFPGTGRKSGVSIGFEEFAILGLGMHQQTGAIVQENCTRCGQFPISFAIKSFFLFNPTQTEWTALPEFPGEGRIGAIGFLIDKKAFVGLGSSFSYISGGPNRGNRDFEDYIDMYELDLANLDDLNWKRVSDFPVKRRKNAAFQALNRGFVFSNDHQSNRLELRKFHIDSDEFGNWNTVQIAMEKKGTIQSAINIEGFALIFLNNSDDNFWMYIPEL